MQINLWYNEEVNQWRWTLTDSTDTTWMESGTSPELEKAMKDVANTVKFIMGS